MDCDLVASFPFDVAVPDVIVFEQGHCAHAQPDERAALVSLATPASSRFSAADAC